MESSRFYELIDGARNSSDPSAPSADPDELREVLDELSDEELLGFGEAFDRELVRLNRWELWGAGYLLCAGMSDDSFHYFRSWILGKGRATVDAVIADPDRLVEFVTDEDRDEDEFENEALEYVSVELLEERGADEPDTELHADDEPAGEEFDEDSLDERYPSIAAWIAARTD